MTIETSAPETAQTTNDAGTFSGLAGGAEDSGRGDAAAKSSPDAKTPESAGGTFDGLLKTDDQKEGGDAEPEEAKEGDATSELPEKYELAAPEGMELSDEIVAAADPVFRELGLSNEQASKLLPLAAELAKAQQAKDVANWTAQTKQWADQIRADPEFGGKELGAHAARAQLAMDKFGDKQLSEDLTKYGLSNHPALFKFFARIGAAMSEDQGVTGREAISQPQSEGDRMYQYASKPARRNA